MATALSAVVVTLVVSVFLVQNRFYSDATKRAGLHESVRSATALLSTDLHSVPVGGILGADEDAVIYRSPVLLGGVCGVEGGKTYLFLPAEEETLDPAMVDGLGVKSRSSEWRFSSAGWSTLYRSSGGEAARACALAGADTVGASDRFYHFDGLNSSGLVQVGDLVMLYQEVEAKLAPSNLHPGTRALYRGPSGRDLVEVATGLSSRSGFLYGLSHQTGLTDRVTGKGNLVRVDRVQFLFEGIAPASSAGRDSLTFDLTLTVPLQDAN